jgi:hypothetical protein
MVVSNTVNDRPGADNYGNRNESDLSGQAADKAKACHGKHAESDSRYETMNRTNGACIGSDLIQVHLCLHYEDTIPYGGIILPEAILFPRRQVDRLQNRRPGRIGLATNDPKFSGYCP